LDATDYTEVLGWEKASQIVSNSRTIGVSLCACRHKADHLGKACAAPQKTCLTFGNSAEMLIKRGMAERIDSNEGMRILELSKTNGLAQLADNVQRQVGFICNCCGCCCGMMQAIRRFDLRGAVVTSNWIASIDESACKGCGACVRACPVDAIEMSDKKAVREESLCLGCGVCEQACKFSAIRMQARASRVVTPETTFDKIVSMALERGKLSNFLFDDPSRWSHRALGRIASIIEKAPPTRALLAVKPIRSKFLTMLAASKK
jgi:ferredoxin